MVNGDNDVDDVDDVVDYNNFKIYVIYVMTNSNLCERSMYLIVYDCLISLFVYSV